LLQDIVQLIEVTLARHQSSHQRTEERDAGKEVERLATAESDGGDKASDEGPDDPADAAESGEPRHPGSPGVGGVVGGDIAIAQHLCAQSADAGQSDEGQQQRDVPLNGHQYQARSRQSEGGGNDWPWAEPVGDLRSGQSAQYGTAVEDEQEG